MSVGDVFDQVLGAMYRKALGWSARGYVVGPTAFVDLHRQQSRSYLFPNAMPPPVVRAVAHAVDDLTRAGATCEEAARKPGLA